MREAWTQSVHNRSVSHFGGTSMRAAGGTATHRAHSSANKTLSRSRSVVEFSSGAGFHACSISMALTNLMSPTGGPRLSS